MLAVLDVPRAVAARNYSRAVTAELGFAVVGQPLDGDAGYRLRVADGRAHCRPDDHPAGPVVTARGFALLYAGAQTCANLRFAGLLRGGSAAEDVLGDAVFAGRPLHIRDYF